MPDPPPLINIDETVFPVMATVPGNAGELERPDFFGTAFAVGPGVYMTAAHVAQAAAARGQLSLGRRDDPGLVGETVYYWEAWPERDIALLFCCTPGTTPLNIWLIHRTQLLMDLASFGYPHAVTRDDGADHFEVVFRGYKGHVITTRGFDRLPGRPAVYEVSCPYPEGLSGAPVLLELGGRLAVAGVVIGSQTVSYGNADHTVGIAMIADEIAELRSDRLGDTLARALGWTAAAWRPGAPPG
jgi:hypothetical protein